MQPSRRLIALGLALLAAGCASNPADASSTRPGDPAYRAFSGNIISLRPTVSTRMVSKADKYQGSPYPNVIEVHYDAATQFYLDGQPTTLDKIDPYMPVSITGHMRGDDFFAETARFSSQLPSNVHLLPAKPQTQ